MRALHVRRLYYGTYPVLGGNTSKWSEDCTNWCSIGPFPGWCATVFLLFHFWTSFRSAFYFWNFLLCRLWSDTNGASWHNSGHFPQGRTVHTAGAPEKTSDNFYAAGGVSYGGLFGECEGHRVSSSGTFVDRCAVSH